MQVADHFSAVKRRFESRAMPAYEKPPAKLVDIYFPPKPADSHGEIYRRDNERIILLSKVLHIIV